MLGEAFFPHPGREWGLLWWVWTVGRRKHGPALPFPSALGCKPCPTQPLTHNPSRNGGSNCPSFRMGAMGPTCQRRDIDMWAEKSQRRRISLHLLLSCPAPLSVVVTGPWPGQEEDSDCKSITSEEARHVTDVLLNLDNCLFSFEYVVITVLGSPTMVARQVCIRRVSQQRAAKRLVLIRIRFRLALGPRKGVWGPARLHASQLLRKQRDGPESKGLFGLTLSQTTCASHTWSNIQHSKDRVFCFYFDCFGLKKYQVMSEDGDKVRLSEHKDATCASVTTVSIRTVSEV